MSRTVELQRMLRLTLQKLGALAEEVVFVGGATVPCYVTDPAAPDARTTMDVDLVVSTLKKGDYHAFEERLREQGFRQDMQDGVICRWRFGDRLLVDVMPTDTSILGFTNRWYKSGYANAMSYDLGGGDLIRIFRLEHFVLSKWEAHKDRGADDPVMSHDLEDVVTVINGAESSRQSLTETASPERDALADMARTMLGNESLLEACEWHSARDAPTQFAEFVSILRSLDH